MQEICYFLVTPWKSLLAFIDSTHFLRQKLDRQADRPKFRQLRRFYVILYTFFKIVKRTKTTNNRPFETVFYPWKPHDNLIYVHLSDALPSLTLSMHVQHYINPCFPWPSSFLLPSILMSINLLTRLFRLFLKHNPSISTYLLVTSHTSSISSIIRNSSLVCLHSMIYALNKID